MFHGHRVAGVLPCATAVLVPGVARRGVAVLTTVY